MTSKKEVFVIGGKGGVGKTAVSAIITKLLVMNKKNFLVIDADPATSLAFALGEKPAKTIGDLREKIIEIPSEKRRIKDRPVKAIVQELIIKSNRGFNLLVMGRAEGPGCFCSLNELLRYGIESLCKDFNVTLIDCEAGIEQVNRRAIHKIDKLILVTDTSIRGFETAYRVMEIASKYNAEKTLKSYLIVNRVKNGQKKEHLQDLAKEFNINIIGFVPEDINIEDYNIKGKPLIDLPDDSPSVLEVRKILTKLESKEC